MSTPYEIEHNIKPSPSNTTSQPPRRPDMSSFFSALSQITTNPSTPSNNPNAIPTPVDVAATERLLHDQFATIYQTSDNPHHRAWLEGLMTQISSLIDSPPKTVPGVPQSYLDELERVNVKKLKDTDSCPICNECFVDDEFPLVVRLPCHKSHVFDLECVGPWLLMNGTCPLDRKDLVPKTKKGKEKGLGEKEKRAEEDEEEYDGMFA